MAASLRDIIEGAAAKYLSAVDADPDRSNGHEIGGLPRVGFKNFLGTPGKGNGEEIRFTATTVLIEESDGQHLSCECEVTWYDARRRNPTRSPEYRLYYRDNIVTDRLREGDFCLIAKLRDGRLLLVFAPPGSEAEHQLRVLFGVAPNVAADAFAPAEIPAIDLILPVRSVLEDLGMALPEPPVDDERLLALLRGRFPGSFPSTREFSRFARTESGVGMDAGPDFALMAWMEFEEHLFRVYERHFVATRLREGFGAYGDDVDDFINFSLSVQNRRKVRVGHAFENHLAEVFLAQSIAFELGRGSNVTEGRSRPDFLFPGFAAYHDPTFPDDRLRMLGAKTTCKDRWRQVLVEANRITRKHLATMEPCISETQTDEMQSHGLQLVVPAAVQQTYTPAQRQWIISLDSFIEEIRSTGAVC